MHTEIDIEGQTIAVELTSSAERSLSQQSSPLIAEMELYFSCLIRKQVRFHTTPDKQDVVYINNKLGVSFRPVMTRTCGKDYEGDEPPLTDFPIHEAQHFIPKWLKIDYRRGQWQGEFGFAQ